MDSHKVGIAGAGNMGRAIAWAMEYFGYDLIILDQDPDSICECQQFLQSHEHSLVCDTSHTFFQDCEMVVSSLPYHQNLDLAKFCIDNNIKYFDLGGHVGTSKNINDYATLHATQPIMTDLGLAPGWVNIVAEGLYQKYYNQYKQVPHTITMMVGGLPTHPINILKYGCTWSYEGLINEYKDDCVVLMDGEKEMCPGMAGLEYPISSDIGNLEAFYTSGGAAHTIDVMQARGVQGCHYKTLRYPGHCDIVQFLIREAGLDIKTLVQIFQQACPPQKDVVVIKATADDFTYQNVIKSDKRFSAMQKATAFPAAAAAHTVRLSGVSGPVLKYDDVRAVQFNIMLDQLFQESYEH